MRQKVRNEKNAPMKSDHPVNILSGADRHNPDCGPDDDRYNTPAEMYFRMIIGDIP